MATQADTRPKRPRTVLFFTCANQPYEHFVPLYILGALRSDPTHQVEVGLEDSARFEREHAALLARIRAVFGDRFLLRDVPWTTADGRRIVPNTVRFLNEPRRRCNFVYIGDVDILHLDDGFPTQHLRWMRRHEMLYANSVRPGTRRLSGLHFTSWRGLYPLPDTADLPVTTENDEIILGQLCERKGLPLQDREWWRPVPGIHFSPNRDPVGAMAADGTRKPGWGIGPWVAAYRLFRNDPRLADIIPLLPPRSMQLLETLDAAVAETAAPVDVAARFAQVHRRNLARGLESPSGTGSSHAATAELVPQLQDLLARRQIASLNDAGCGDFHWMAPVAGQVRYRGFDVVPDVLALARQASPATEFIEADLTRDLLPQADLVLCRDLLVHLPDALALETLRLFQRSQARWLLAGHFPDLLANAPGALGGWRPLNLQAAPFNFPPPQELLVERPSAAPHPKLGRKCLGLWRLDALRT